MKKNNKPCKKPKCKACYDKGYYTQFVGERGSDDFGGEGYVIDPHIQKFPCPKCIRIQNGHKEDCDFVNSDQGVCNCFQPEQKECECYCHKDKTSDLCYACPCQTEAERRKIISEFHSHPQPTDGLIDELLRALCGYTNGKARMMPPMIEEKAEFYNANISNTVARIKQLFAEQREKQ